MNNNQGRLSNPDPTFADPYTGAPIFSAMGSGKGYMTVPDMGPAELLNLYLDKIKEPLSNTTMYSGRIEGIYGDLLKRLGGPVNKFDGKLVPLKMK